MKCITLLKGCMALLFFATVLTATNASAEVRLNGSGASFPFPLYSMWFKDFSQNSDDIRVDYQAKGSGAGIQDFTNQVVDFAGSDAAMSDEEIEKADNGVVLLPITAGEIVLTYNLDGVEELRLPRDVYPDIFMGKITRWNDPAIAQANPDVELPDESITVVVRSDSSGTTYVFTGHLAEIDEAFKETVSQGKSPQWPKSNNFVKAPKNDGVTATVQQTPGAIGYIEYGYAKLTGAKTAMLENKAGEFVSAGAEAGSAALASAEFPEGTLPGSDIPDLRVWVYDPSGENAYPIATFTWLIFPTDYQDEEKAKAAQELVEYALTQGQDQADELGYIPLPENVVEKVRTASQMIQ